MVKVTTEHVRLPDLAWQPTLGEAATAPDLSFERRTRHRLDAQSWIDVVPGWLHHHEDLFEELLRSPRWAQRQRRMYDRVVDEPRLVAGWRDDDLADLSAAHRAGQSQLSQTYSVQLDSVLSTSIATARTRWPGMATPSARPCP